MITRPILSLYYSLVFENVICSYTLRYTPVAEVVSGVVHNPHVAVRLHEAVAPRHRAIRQPSLSAELYVAGRRLFDVVPVRVRTRSLRQHVDFILGLLMWAWIQDG